MAKEKDYEYIVGKMSKTDKEGNDVTGDRIGKGGRHREDGTYSAVVYDIEVVDEDPTQAQSPQPQRVVDDSEAIDRYSYPQQQASPTIGEIAAEDFLRPLFTYALNRATDKIINSFEKWYNDRKRRKAAEKFARSKEDAIKQSSLKEKKEKEIEMSVDSNNGIKDTISSGTFYVDLNSAFENYSINMTKEEAQKEFLDAYIFYLISAKKIWRLQHATIVDSDGIHVGGKDFIQKLSDPILLGNINQIIENNPNLLDDWETVALNKIMGQEVLNNAIFAPLQSEKIRDYLSIEIGSDENDK